MNINKIEKFLLSSFILVIAFILLVAFNEVNYESFSKIANILIKIGGNIFVIIVLIIGLYEIWSCKEEENMKKEVIRTSFEDSIDKICELYKQDYPLKQISKEVKLPIYLVEKIIEEKFLNKR